MFDDSVARMKLLLGMTKSPTAENVALLTKYGLGHKRTLDALIQFTGIDFRSQQVFADRCKQLEWVPFTPDSHPMVEDGDAWGSAPEILPQGHASIPLLSGNHRIIEIPSPFSDENDETVIAKGEENNSQSSSSSSSANNNNLAAEVAETETIPTNSRGELDNNIIEESAFSHEKSSTWLGEISLGPIDWFVDAVVKKIDLKLSVPTVSAASPQHHRHIGHKMVKVVLLGLPLFVSVVWAAAYTLTSGHEQAVETLSKRV